jgi:hypothetical protein
MFVSISSEKDPYELTQLYHWLRQDAQLVREAEIGMASPGGTGQMGVFDVVTVVLTQFTGLASLAVAFAGWRQSRRQVCELTVRRGDVVVTINDQSPEEVQRLIASLATTEDNEQAVADG